MSCKSTKCLGNKARTYLDEINHTLNALTNKTSKKLEQNFRLNKLKGYFIFRKGYELYPTPFIYFDFLDNTDINLDARLMNIKLEPQRILPLLRKSAMITKDPLLLTDLRHDSNARFFRFIIPIEYYNYDNSNLIKIVRI